MVYKQECIEEPENPVNNQEFQCPGCTYKAIYNQELGDWVPQGI